MDENFFVVSFIAVSSEKYKANDNNKLFCKYFLVSKMAYTKLS